MRAAPLLCLTLLLFGTAATAQEQSPPPWHHRGHHHDWQRHFEARTAAIEASLHLTPAQKPLWDAYIGVLRDKMKARAGQFRAMRGQPPADLPSRLDLRIRRLNSEIQSAALEKQALLPLWAALDSDQRQTLSTAIGWHRHGKWGHPPKPGSYQ